MLKFFLHIRAAAYHIQIPLPLFPFRIDWIWQAGFGLRVGTTSGTVAALIRFSNYNCLSVGDCLFRLIDLAGWFN